MLDIRKIPIDPIHAAAYNPRVDLQPEDPEYIKLCRSIEEFGYVEQSIHEFVTKASTQS